MNFKKMFKKSAIIGILYKAYYRRRTLSEFASVTRYRINKTVELFMLFVEQGLTLPVFIE